MAGAGEYKRGTMDIAAQRQTYSAVMKSTLWGTVAVVIVLVLLALITL